MVSSINSFKTYIKTQSTALRISDIRNHKVKGKIILAGSNKLMIDFGHYNNSKITTDEISQYFKANRKVPLIINQTDLLNNRINLNIKEITPQESPVLQNFALQFKSKNFTTKLNSLAQLKRAFVFKKLVHGKIIKKIKGGFLVLLLGFFAFLPTSHFIAYYNSKKRSNNLDLTKVHLLLTNIPLEILGIKCLKSKSNLYYLNIIVSLKKALKILEKHHKTLNTKKLVKINKLKNCKILKHNL